MKVIYIATYPPRKCGIGTYTNNLIKSVTHNTKSNSVKDDALVIAMNEDNSEYEYPEEVKFVIRSNHQKDYIQASRFINFSGADVCVIQHEFGIFGGEMGVYILPLINRLKIPLVVCFHTVLKNPSYIQKSIVSEIRKKAAHVIVMSNLAVHFLKSIYKIPQNKIELIEHGVPDFEHLSPKAIKEQLGFKDRHVLMTFGLIGRNKGIETVLHALPAVVKKYPNLLYIILGRTHPAVLKLSGEEYREYLKLLVKKYKLENNVYFHNHFVSDESLFEYLSASDIYVTPYLSEEQITSGTLSYAVGAGLCVISTPYWHAKELLDKGRGILFNFKDYETLSNILVDLLDHPEKLKKYQTKAREYGHKIKWLKSAKQHLQLYKKIVRTYKVPQTVRKFTIDLTVMPILKLEHVYRLTDDTGIVKHAKYGIPNLKDGYCLNDNSRALLMAVMYYKQRQDRKILDMMPHFLSYIHYMQNSDGTFRNYLGFDRSFKDELGTEDAFGRAVWGLGYLVRFKPNDAFKQTGKEIFLRSVPHFEYLRSIRGIANTIIGICYFLKEYSEREDLSKLLIRLVGKLTGYYKKHSTNDWKWFESRMTYDNGILPLALLHAYDIIEDEKVLNIARESLEFLESIVFREGYFSPVGDKSWLSQDKTFSKYDQQSSEAMGMVLLYSQAFQLFKKKKYLQHLFKSYLWYLGENELRIPLYDHESGGCFDGLTYKGVNKNEGADSTLAYLISHLTVLQAHEKEHFIIYE